MGLPEIEGFLLALSLIVPIGAQNSFVLRQGLIGTHILPIVLICACSDAILIAVGVAGLSILTDMIDGLTDFLRYGGAVFLLVYAAVSLRRAWIGSATPDTSPDNSASTQLGPILALIIGFTWLNPHVYLDTVILLGSLAAQYGDQSWRFGIGAMSASFIFFFSLGYGARLLRPLFSRPQAWRILDVIIAGIMTTLAISLLL